MSHFIENNSIVIAETGVALFSAAEMLMPEGTTFIARPFSIDRLYSRSNPGAATAARDRRVVLFVGDGSFR